MDIVFMGIWMTINIINMIRFRRRQVDFARSIKDKLPPMLFGDPLFINDVRDSDEVLQLMRNKYDDPIIEKKRKRMWRAFFQTFAWAVGTLIIYVIGYYFLA